jgi:2,4-dienoyl-CoA reductase-like NADH-dependent reductase (Old Yellow Enzyme family)
MPRGARYDILFEPVCIGPVASKNRFFQVPHCNGVGMSFPSRMIAMRRIKAEGGQAVVLHPWSAPRRPTSIPPATCRRWSRAGSGTIEWE